VNIAIIPARGGSKRIPKKNIKKFCGKPLIAYSIETALNSGLFEKVLVSTDSDEIASVAKKYGADVQMRPKKLADDFTGTWDVIEYVLEALKKDGEFYEFVCTIYATAPFLDEKYLKEGYEKLKNSDAIRAFSVTTMPFPIQRTFKITDGRCQMFWPENYNKRSQDLEEAYQDAGQFYWEKVGKKSNEIFFGKDSIPIVLPRHLVQDIDTMEDFTRAELMYKALNEDKFDEWNKAKKLTHNTIRKTGFKEKEIFWLRMGQNIGSEEYGKGNEFQRPVLIIKKLTFNLFIGIPLTSKLKEDNDYFHTISYRTKKGIIENSTMLLQIKSFDKKRLMGKIGTLEEKQFSEVLKKLNKLFIPS
jgi:pseudaminic acid cytidylyltransferase